MKLAKPTSRILRHREGGGQWVESPDVDGWSAAGDSYADEAIHFALGHDAALEHYVPAGKHVRCLTIS